MSTLTPLALSTAMVDGVSAVLEIHDELIRLHLADGSFLVLSPEHLTVTLDVAAANRGDVFVATTEITPAYRSVAHQVSLTIDGAFHLARRGANLVAAGRPLRLDDWTADR